METNSEKPLEYYLLVFRFMLDQFWVNYQFYSIPLFSYLVIKKLYKPIDFSLCKTHKELLPWRKEDKLTFLCIFFAIIYYFLDATLLVITGLYHHGGICKKMSFLHHIAAIYQLYFITTSNHYLWWQVFPGLLHAFMINYPEYTSLNYIYLVFIWVFIIGVNSKPFCNWTHYKQMKYATFLIISILIPTHFLNCTNESVDYSYLFDINDPRNVISSVYQEFQDHIQ